MNILIHFLWILVLSGGTSAISEEDRKRCKDAKKMNEICGEHTYQSISPILRYVDQLQKQTEQINELQDKAQLLQQREIERTFMVDLIEGKKSHIEDLKATIFELRKTIRVLEQKVESVNYEKDSLRTYINGELHRQNSFTDPNAAKLRYCEIELNKKNIFISESTVDLGMQNIVNEQRNQSQLNTEVNSREVSQAQLNANQDELHKQETQVSILKESQIKQNEYQNFEMLQNFMFQQNEHHVSESSGDISQITLNQNHNQNFMFQQNEHHVSESSGDISQITLNQNQNQNFMFQQNEHHVSKSSSAISQTTLNQNQNQNFMFQQNEHHVSESSGDISQITLNQNQKQNFMFQQNEHHVSESSSDISQITLNHNQDEFKMQKAQFRTPVESNDLILRESQTTLNDNRRDVGEIQNCSTTYANSSGIHSITIPKIATFPALCNSEIAGPGWTVIEQRINGKENFTRTWKTYQNGFGDFTGDFFLGLEKIHRLTNDTPNELYIHMEAYKGGEVEKKFNNTTFFVRYDNFSIAGEDDKYSIVSLGKYTGSDTRGYMEIGSKFSSFDSDNDKWVGNCGLEWRGGWWYTGCGHLNPNGVYKHEEVDAQDSNFWVPNYSVKSIVMMIRPLNYNKIPVTPKN